MRKDKKPLSAAALFSISIAVFILLARVLGWSYWISGLVSVGTYLSLALLFPEIQKIGSTPVEELTSGETLKAELEESMQKIEHIGKISRSIADPDIRTMGLELYDIGSHIMEYLNHEPKKISKSLYFLSYDVDTALRIIDNYNTLSQNISSRRLAEVKSNTEKSLGILVKRFENERDGFYESKLEDLKLDTDILTKTLEMQEIEKQKEDLKTSTDAHFASAYPGREDSKNGRTNHE